MRIKSIAEVGNNQQPNPFQIQSAGSAPAGKSASPRTFEECLRAQLQDSKNIAAIRNAESQAGSLFMGLHMLPLMAAKPELKPKARADESQSDL